MSDRTDKQLLEEYEQLKAGTLFSIHEGTDQIGHWHIVFKEQLGTANPFPGIHVQSPDLEAGRIQAMKEFKGWGDKSQKSFEEMDRVYNEYLKNNPSNHFPTFQEQTVQLLTEIRDELRMMNRKPLYVVVNNPQSVKEFADAVRRYEEEVAIVEQIRKEDNQS